jgi:DNA polymerase I-like protein with 3'-5' exonuclease and polymerase domains
MKLIVADYGQLELRILAHMTNCKAMIEAFRLGGDFHSRTALVSLMRCHFGLGYVPRDPERS